MLRLLPDLHCRTMTLFQNGSFKTERQDGPVPLRKRLNTALKNIFFIDFIVSFKEKFKRIFFNVEGLFLILKIKKITV